MLALLMVVAACWGVVQLAVVGSLTRTVRVVTLLLAVAVGMYGCGILTIGLQYAVTRAWARVTGEPVFQVVATAGYTVDPFIEEVVKVLPLIVAALWLPTRRQWTLTDYTLVGAGLGAGFGLLEALMRFGDRADRAVAFPTGWLFPSFSPPFIPDLPTSLTSWLPAPVSAIDLLAFPAAPATNPHLVWSAVAGFGIGVLARVGSRWRVLGVLPVVLVGADHAAFNYALTLTGRTPLGDVVTAPLRWAHPSLWAWPLIVLAIAVALDLSRARRARAAHPDLLLAGESPTVIGEWVAAVRYAALRPPWPGVVVWRFVLMRRAALHAATHDRGTTHDSTAGLLAEVTRTRALLDQAGTSQAWRGVGVRRALRQPNALHQPDRQGTGRVARLKRHWPVAVWTVLALPTVLYYGIGSTPALATTQDTLSRPWVLPVLVVLLLAGLGWTAWQAVAAARALPATTRLPGVEPATRTAAHVGIGAGALLLGVVVLSAALTGTPPDQAVIDNYFHVLDAVSDLLLVAGIALMLASIIFFPPVAAIAVAGGGIVLVPTVTSGFLTLTALGLSGILLSQAVGGAGARGIGSGAGPGRGTRAGPAGDRVPDIPQQPPRPPPRVQHWKLRNIVDNLWHKHDRSDRIGNGTTMDALRNEIRTGRPTQGRFHREKVERELRALKRWLDRFGNTASRQDRLAARKLQAELDNLLGGS